MYPGDPEARVVELKSVPQCKTGAPCPRIFANEHRVILVYLAGGRAESEPRSYALLRFIHPRDHMFGAPNDEAMEGHPLYKNGLSFYGVYQVFDSPWIRQLKKNEFGSLATRAGIIP